MEVRAINRFIRIAPLKLRLVADQIRNKRVVDALNILSFTRKFASRDVKKTLKSAISNAMQNKTIDVDNLFVKRITVDGGPMLKRFSPAAHGRATPIRRRTSHLLIVLSEE